MVPVSATSLACGWMSIAAHATSSEVSEPSPACAIGFRSHRVIDPRA
jgi:hypothetical protein